MPHVPGPSPPASGPASPGPAFRASHTASIRRSKCASSIKLNRAGLMVLSSWRNDVHSSKQRLTSFRTASRSVGFWMKPEPTVH
jgi:hypothetical protein